jgi:DNA-binding SARP family transcriptional activator
LRQQEPHIEIFTLGKFVVRQGDQVLTEESQAQKVWTLFQYLLTQKGHQVSVDTLVEVLWPEQEFDDPRTVLKSLVYRLRNTLGQDGHPQHQYIISARGSYGFNTQSSYWLDSEELESLCLQAEELAQEDPDAATELNIKALELYQGDYLPGNQYTPRTLMTRQRYKRFYLTKTLELIQLLKEKGQWDEIRQVCERFFAIEPLEEDVHLHFMESLLAEGQVNKARAHYQYVSYLFFQQHGTSPSPAMRELYRKISASSGNLIMDIKDIQDSIRTRNDADGALFCDQESFRLFYEMEERRLGRNGQAVVLSSLTILGKGQVLPQRELDLIMTQLGVILKEALRRGDIICRWNDAQYLVLLNSLNFEQAQRVLARVKDTFQKKYGYDHITLRCQSRPLQPLGA